MKYNRYNRGEELQRTQLTVPGQGRMSCAIKKCPNTVRTEVTHSRREFLEGRDVEEWILPHLKRQCEEQMFICSVELAIGPDQRPRVRGAASQEE